MKSCDVFMTDDAVYVFAHTITERGAALSIGPYFRLPATADAGELGETVLKAVAASQDEAPHPKDLKAVTSQLVSYLGTKSWRAFAKAVRGHAAIALQGSQVLVIPHKRGPRDYFLGVEDRSTRCPADPESVGSRLLAMVGPGGTDRLA